jgi:hypothetical protein
MIQRRPNWRWVWMLLSLWSTAFGGCAAFDLLDGPLPEAEPATDPRPYPPPAKPDSAEAKPALGAGAATPQTQALAPMVTPAEAAAKKSAAVAPLAATMGEAAGLSATDSAGTKAPAAANPAPTAAGAAPANGTSGAAPAPQAPATINVQSANPAVENSSGVNVAASSAPQGSPEAEATSEKPRSRQERWTEIVRRRDELVQAMEEELELRRSEDDKDHELALLEQQLRLLYLVSERPDDAVEEIASLPAAEQEAYKQLLFALRTWLAEEESRRPHLRNSRVLRSLADATSQLAAAAKLDVKNLRFCERVEGYGWYTEFATTQFRPKQQVILYAEIENFTSQKKGPDSYETELQGSYQIFDAEGTLVDERQLPLDKEVCRNPRRDYFLAYRLYLPEGLSAGRYRLELTIEDLKAKDHYPGRKLGDGMIEFSIRP